MAGRKDVGPLADLGSSPDSTNHSCVTWVAYFASLFLSFLVCPLGIKIPCSNVCCEDYRT